MTHASTHTHPSLAFLGDHQPLSPLADLALRVAVVATKWQARRSTRLALSRLDAHLLKDIGLDRHVAHSETRRMFWQS